MNVHLLDTGAGNIRSVVNAISSLGYNVIVTADPSHLKIATHVIFPGVGAFGSSMLKIKNLGFVNPIKEYIASGRPFMGICVGLQSLCLGSEESIGVDGLGVIPAFCSKFDSTTKAVPHMGWNSAVTFHDSNLLNHDGPDTKYYFVHSYGIPFKKSKISPELKEWVYSLTTYGTETFISSVRKGNVFATQFHPEKSGWEGQKILKSFLDSNSSTQLYTFPIISDELFVAPPSRFTNRIIACLDVRENDEGDLVVTKGDQYDVREVGEGGKSVVRNMGKPVELASRYFLEGADEITFLNITSFRSNTLDDLPMLNVLRLTSEKVFVPLTIGGGIREIKDQKTNKIIVSALDVATEYFRSGADKVSIGSDAVYAAESYLKTKTLSGTSSIEQISHAYGAQAVVISVDPRRVYVESPTSTTHRTIKTKKRGPKGEEYCWFECTVNGGRVARDLDVVQLTQSCEALGAGEILLNSMDADGTNLGFDVELLKLVKGSVRIPVIASSGAGRVEDFEIAFEEAGVDAALAAGIFHRKEVKICDVKGFLKGKGYEVRL